MSPNVKENRSTDASRKGGHAFRILTHKSRIMASENFKDAWPIFANR